MLADRNGFRVYVEGEKLKFKKVEEPRGPVATLEWGLDLRSFRPRLTSHGQVSEVTVRGWDPKKKEAIVGTAQHGSAVKSRQVGESKSGFAFSNEFGDAKSVIVDWPIHSVKEAQDLAKSYMDKRESSSIEADGLCTGNNKIKAGVSIDVKHVGAKFSAKYTVASSTHTFTPAEGYTTQFVCSGKDPHTVLGLLSGEKGDQANMGGNIVVALVTNLEDPDNKGRIKVKYPWLMENHESFWIRVSAPMAGPDRGFYFLPEVNDEVLVAFEHGDIHRGYMIGALWNGKDSPVEPNNKAVVGGKVVHRVIKTRKGHIVMLQDTDDEEHVKITTMGNHYLILDDKKGAKKCEILTDYGHQVLLDDQARKITVKTKDGHKIEIDDPGKKIVVQDSNGTEKMTIDAAGNNINFECLKDFTVSAKGNVTIEGLMGVKVSSPATLSLSSTGPAELKSSAILTVQGTMVKIN
jgi:phage baseplate assembly protein gpV